DRLRHRDVYHRPDRLTEPERADVADHTDDLQPLGHGVEPDALAERLAAQEVTRKGLAHPDNGAMLLDVGALHRAPLQQGCTDRLEVARADRRVVCDARELALGARPRL